MEKGTRADAALFAAGLASSRTAARRLIEEGRALCGGAVIGKASQTIGPDDALSVAPVEREYVSRGAHKLLGALRAFDVAPAGLVCADIGASTGGFTQVLLDAGARRVYAIDAGVNQLAPSLREDARVLCMERTNARYLRADTLPEPIELIVYDVSFISAALLYPAMGAILAPGGRIIGLIKPQFEAGRQAVGKGGIVKDPRDHARAICALRDAAALSGFRMTNLIPSPIRGGDGNIEYLALFASEAGGEATAREDVERVVKAAFGRA